MSAMTGIIGHGHAHQARQENLIIHKNILLL